MENRKHHATVGLPSGQMVWVGDIISVNGEHGTRYRVTDVVENASGSLWLDCYGGKWNKRKSRSFSVDRVRRIESPKGLEWLTNTN
jgi:hypothetical protein